MTTWSGTLAGTAFNIYVDGSEPSYNSTFDGSGSQIAPTGTWSAGGYVHDDAANLPGRIAELAYWNRVLSVAEISSLAAGYSPLFILNGLVFYPKDGLARDTPNDYISGNAATLDGSTVTEHPRIIRPVTVNQSFSHGLASPPISLVTGGGGIYDVLGNYHRVT